jgi:hypothetical protein
VDRLKKYHRKMRRVCLISTAPLHNAPVTFAGGIASQLPAPTGALFSQVVILNVLEVWCKERLNNRKRPRDIDRKRSPKKYQ